MEDVQSNVDDRGLPIDEVGVTDLRYPITVLDPRREKQETIAQLILSVDLPHHFKGTHMSRFIELLNEHHGEVTMHTLPQILREMQRKFEADSARIEVHFPYFIEQTAPVSGAKALMDYDCSFIGEVHGDEDDFVLGIRVPVASLCPCSKAISKDYGAHNQRGYVTLTVRSLSDENGHPQIIWIEELIAVIEQSASAPVYALLKRADERHVTMQAYDNPVFVEDIVRNVAAQMQIDPRVAWFEVEVVNQGSIHNHSAFARIMWECPLTDADALSELDEIQRQIAGWLKQHGDDPAARQALHTALTRMSGACVPA